MTYTPKTAKEFRMEKGTQSEKITSELTLLDADKVSSNAPDANYKKITNFYWDINGSTIVVVTEA